MVLQNFDQNLKKYRIDLIYPHLHVNEYIDKIYAVDRATATPSEYARLPKELSHDVG